MSELDPSVDRFTRSQRNSFSSVRLDRLERFRDDDAWIEKSLKSPKTRIVPLWRSRNLLVRGDSDRSPVYLRAGEIEDLDAIQPPTLLGTDGHCCFFTVSVSDAQRTSIIEIHPGAQFIDLRRASMDIDAQNAGVLAYARALHYWQYRNAFCGVCGSPNLLQSAGHRLVCSNEQCGRESFPRIDPAIIVLVTHRDACLLGRNAAWPPKRYSTLAGFVEPGESLEDAVVREVFEESRVRLSAVRYVSSQPWPFPASAMCGFYAEAEDRRCRATDEMEEVLWLSAAELKNALLEGQLRLPPPVSIAFRLIADWFRKQTGGRLRDVVLEAKQRAQGNPTAFRA